MLKQIKASTLITEVPLIDSLNSKSSVKQETKDKKSENKNNLNQKTSKNANKNDLNTKINDKNSSYFKSKTNFKAKEIEILDYYLNNHIEYLDLEKYEQHFKDFLVKQNIQYSNLKSEIKNKNKLLHDLDLNINEVVINHFALNTSNGMVNKTTEIKESNTDDSYNSIIEKLNAQM